MSLSFEVIGDAENTEDCRRQTVRALGEILPYVLAKYGISRDEQPRHRNLATNLISHRGPHKNI